MKEDNNIELDEEKREDLLFEQNITIDCDENDYIAFSLYNEKKIDGFDYGKWVTTDWLHLNTFTFNEDVKHMTTLMVYIKYKKTSYRYSFQHIKADHYLLTIENGQVHPVVKINNKNASRRDELFRYDPYIFCCGCCSTIGALDDYVQAQDPNRPCVIS